MNGEQRGKKVSEVKEGRKEGSLSETETIDDYEQSSVRKGSEEKFNGITNTVKTIVFVISAR